MVKTHLKEISQWEVNCDMILLDVEEKKKFKHFPLSKSDMKNIPYLGERKQ